MTMLNNERLVGLLAYLNGLTKVKFEGDYLCQKEMTECIGWIREEFTKEDEEILEHAHQIRKELKEAEAVALEYIAALDAETARREMARSFDE